MKSKTKFKVGDKVKILPSATTIGVEDSEVGTTQTILQIESPTTIVITDSTDGRWHVYPRDITPVFIVGQQLLFSFME